MAENCKYWIMCLSLSHTIFHTLLFCWISKHQEIKAESRFKYLLEEKLILSFKTTCTSLKLYQSINDFLRYRMNHTHFLYIWIFWEDGKNWATKFHFIIPWKLLYHDMLYLLHFYFIGFLERYGFPYGHLKRFIVVCCSTIEIQLLQNWLLIK